MEIPAEYRGREQAYIKHTLLETYLFKLFMIIGQSLPTVSYVDCLAGPWQEASACTYLNATEIYTDTAR